MEAIKVELTTPSVRLEDLTALVRSSADSVIRQMNDTIDPMESHRYETVVSVEELYD